MNVTDKVVANEMCIGCGICAAICPNDALAMNFNEEGEYNSYLVGHCLENCRLCLDICPFNDNKNEDELADEKFSDELTYDKTLGYYLNTFAGHVKSNDIREVSASGGLTTWILEKLLLENKVDRIINVRNNENGEKLFKFQVTDSVNSIREGAGSAYYPVEMSEVIEKVLEEEGRYALVALPCFLKGIELAKEKNRLLDDRIEVSIGLVCGQLKNKEFTNYIGQLAGTEGKLKEVTYRNTEEGKPANNYYYEFRDNGDSESSNRMFWKDGISKVWHNRWFTPKACNFCDDVFAELADVTLMDAWLPEFIQDSRGNNLLIVRDENIQNLLIQGEQDNSISLDTVSADQIIISQKGLIDIKREKIRYRLFLASENNEYYPEKREEPDDNFSLSSKKEIFYRDLMQDRSKDLWKKVKGEDFSMDEFNSTMEKEMRKLSLWKKLYNLKNLFKKFLKKLGIDLEPSS